MKLFLVVLVSVCLPGFVPGILGVDYGVSYPSYNPSYPSYSPPAYSSPPYYSPPSYQPSYSYSPPAYTPPYQPAYSPPTYYETYDTQVDYKEANQTRHCGILPTVHHNYGYARDRVSFGEYPWQVQILDNYNNYKCAGALISPRHVITSSYCVDNLDIYTVRVRVGEWDLQSDKNYQEVYKNYELTVCKKHPFYPVPGYGYDQYASYPVAILELYADVDMDQYPHVEPVCIPEYYYLSKSYTAEYSYSYGYGSQYGGGGSSQAAPGPQDRNEEGADKDLECIVLGHQESPVEKLEYQSQSPSYTPPPSYGYGQSYNPPAYSYESYEYSRTPRRAKLRKVYGQQPQYNSYGYGYTPKVDTWEAEYYFDACHADLGSPIFCLVEGKYEEEEYYPAYPPSYPPPAYEPSYNPPSYPAPSYYSPPAYSAPQYYSPAPSYNPPSYQYKREAPYYPSYAPPSYYPTPSYSPPSYYPTPSYSSPPYYSPPAYNPPVYEDYYKYPIKVAENLNREYRRAVLYGVVQYPTQCSYGYGASTNKITATPAKDIVTWIENVLHTPASCSSYSSYYPSYPAY